MWLDRFERVDGKLKAVAINPSGSTESLTLEQMHKARPGLNNAQTMMFDTSFSQWERTSARKYASAFGIKSGVTEHHEIYLIRYGHTDIVLPASELQRTLFAMPPVIVGHLYRPNSMEHFCAPILSDDGLRTLVIPRKAFTKPRRVVAFEDRLVWFYAYPSAYRAWNSVYRFACSGRIAMDLPAAEVTIQLRGKYINKTFYAQRADILALTPCELPLEWTNLQSRKLVLANPQRQHVVATRIRDTRLLPLDGKWQLTDAEWDVIRKIVSRRIIPGRDGRPPRHRIRSTVDGILTKMGTGKSWGEVAVSISNVHASNALYRRIAADGRWEEIADFLAGSRREASPPAH